MKFVKAICVHCKTYNLFKVYKQAIKNGLCSSCKRKPKSLIYAEMLSQG